MSQKETFDKLLSLLKNALLGHEFDRELFLSLETEDWRCIYEMAQVHGVISIVFDSIQKHELFCAHNNDSLMLLMEWAGYAHIVNQQYNKYKVAAASFALFLKDNGYDYLIMKGLSLTPYYPIPENRSFGDIDIFGFDNHENINSVVRKLGINIEVGDKHDVFYYDGIMFEHHKTFIGQISEPARIMERFLQSVVSIELCKKTEDGWYMPNERFNAIFLLRHMSKHYFGEGINLKQILDWGLFLHSTDISTLNIKQVLEESGMVVAWNTFTGIAGKILNLDFSNYLFGNINKALLYRVLSDIINYNQEEEHRAGVFKRLHIKTRRLFACKWIFDSGLLPDKFWTDVVWVSIRDHLKKPKFI